MALDIASTAHATNQRLVELNNALLNAEKDGDRAAIDPWLNQNFTIVRASDIKQDRQAYLEDVPHNNGRGRSADRVQLHLFGACAVYLCRVATRKNREGNLGVFPLHSL